MDDLISVCIPAFNRPKLLLEAVESCFAQAHRPLEILVGDDSPDDATATAVNGIVPPSGVAIRYVHNASSLGQAGNVNTLFGAARGPRLVLLHDDDALLPGGLDLLIRAWDAHDDVAAVYGKQQYVDDARAVLAQRTEAANRHFCKTAEWQGAQESAFMAGLRQQFPNNGYLVRAELARSVGYRSREEIGGFVVDFDFGIRLGLAAEPAKFVYVDAFTSMYRVHLDSVSWSGREAFDVHLLYESLLRMEVPGRYKAACRNVYERLAMQAFRTYLHDGNRLAALRVYLSPNYPTNRASAKGLFHFASILMPMIFRYRQQRLLRARARKAKRA
jgi:glycosyltransferase involved in cell wall biosynthesis